MKKVIIYSIGFAFMFSSCSDENGKNSTDSGNTKESIAQIDSDKFQEMALEPCTLLSLEMVVEKFKVSAEDIEKKDHVSKNGKLSAYSYCKYLWKKPNFEEIQERIVTKMIEAAKKRDTKNSIQTAMNMETPYFEVGVSNFKVYDSKEKATKYFSDANKVPEKKDLEKLNKAIDTVSDEKLSKEDKEMGNDLVGGIASKMKFEKVEGVGDLAFWDYLDKRLNVLYGNVQIGFHVYISDDKDENIKLAKELANEIMKDF